MTDYSQNYINRILSLLKREDHRPWGYYRVLSDEKTHKVKRIVVYPGPPQTRGALVHPARKRTHNPG